MGKLRAYTLAVLGSLALASVGGAAPETYELPLEAKTPEIADALKRLLQSVEGTDISGAPKVSVRENRAYVISGDLFGDGRKLALTTLSGTQPPDEAVINVGLAEFVKGRWEPRRLWNISPIWAAKDPYEDEHEFVPIRPAFVPFELVNLGGDAKPEVLLSGPVELSHQNYLVLALDKERLPRVVAQAHARPEFKENLLRLEYTSGRLAMWTRQEFHRWTGPLTLQRVAAWQDEVPFDKGGEDSFSRVWKRGADGKEKQLLLWNAEAGLQIYAEPLNPAMEGEPSAEFFEKEKPLATLQIQLPVGQSLSSNFSEVPFLFENLTGLPWSLMPVQTPPVSFPPDSTVTVTGAPELVKLLSRPLPTPAAKKAPK